MNNTKYTIQDLIHDQSFRRMVRGRATGEEMKKWDKWIEENEYNRMAAKKAMAEIAGFEFLDPETPDLEKEWRKLYKATTGQKGTHSSTRNKKYNTLTWIYRIAAVLILGAVMGAGFYLYTPISESATQLEQITEEQTISTKSGEQKTVRFSNDSKIIINSNSEITYSIEDQHQTINVVIEGEAFFDAESDPKETEPVFAIRTPDGVVTDIGTEFMVTVHRDRSRVVLEDGKVLIRTKDQTSSDQISMIAGEMLEFNQSKVISKQKVNPTFYTSWATGFMRFNQTSIREFAGFVEQRFDVKVQIMNEGLSGIKIDGGIYFRSLEELVRSVSNVADIPVYQSEDRETVFIGDRH